jgi:hypothetical protein
MEEHEVDPSSDKQSPDDGSTRNRRSFLRNVLAGLFMAVPAIRALWAAEPASADPAHAHCASGNTYVVYRGHYCYCGRMIGVYFVYCKVCGDVCRGFTDDEGPC